MSEFVFVCEDEASKHEGVELPSEGDGSLLLSVLQSQFEGASGLKYRNPSTGLWRAVKITDGVVHPPTDSGWGTTPYVVVRKPEQKAEETGKESSTSGDGYKRKSEDQESERAAKNPRSSSPDLPLQDDGDHGDLIILGLAYSVTDAELKSHFEQYGHVSAAEVKKEQNSGRSRGFGFVRLSDPELQTKVQGMQHVIKGRRVELKYPKKSPSYLPCKLFVGCLPLRPQTTQSELEEHFAQYGELSDVYVPSPYRGFGFVTYKDGNVAKSVVSMVHTLGRSTLNVSLAEPKGARQGAYPYDQFQQQWLTQQVLNATQNVQFNPYGIGSPLAAFTAASRGQYTRSQQPGGSFPVQQASPLVVPQTQTAPTQQTYQAQGYQDSADRARFAPPPPPPAAGSWQRDAQGAPYGAENVGYSRQAREPQYPQDSKTWNY